MMEIYLQLEKEIFCILDSVLLDSAKQPFILREAGPR